MRRVQRRRERGWRMPPNTIYVGRPTRWGNDFTPAMLDLHGRPLGLERALGLYEASTRRFVEDGPSDAVEAWLAPLRGKDLACWCPLDQPCHADLLLELAASGTRRMEAMLGTV